MRQLALFTFVFVTFASSPRAQQVRSLGLPEVYKPYLGFSNGLWREGSNQLSTQFQFGVFRDITNPTIELLGIGVEGYGGFRNVHPDYGVRAMLLSPLLCVGAGLDYNLRAGRPDLLLRIVAPVRRSGIIGRGSDVRIEFLPTRSNSWNVGLTLPIAQPRRGHGRPRQDYVRLRAVRPEALAFTTPDSALAGALSQVREAGAWINRMMAPALDGVVALKARLADRTAESEIRFYHAALTQAFSLALADSGLGARAAERAKTILLEDVLFPYNRLIGQKKRDDTTREFGRSARGSFARWLVTEARAPTDRMDAALYVFQSLLDVVEEIRAANHESMQDSRLVWLPLQLALLPEQYDEQAELDTLISHAGREPVTHGNRVWYLPNERFQPQLIRSISRAEEYHILWVHDFRGTDDEGRPDRFATAVVTQAYLTALRARIAQYDSTGHLPVYMIFLDQFYFEQSRSRALLRVLLNPLGNPPPARDNPMREAIMEAQQQLREAVGHSRLLSAERAQRGEAWLHQLVKVHISITNPGDASFRSGGILPIVGLPDNVMRDHRKVVLYDVSEDDPYRGMAMYTGMGVGQKYSGPGWEDRAIMVQGPAALALRDEARELLASQGISADQAPWVLQPRAKPPDYGLRIQHEIERLEAAGRVAAGVSELHNHTGFATKEIAVAEATLFNLMAPGGVVKVPDSIWLNELYGSLLAGAALRGVRVLVIATSKTSAPDLGWPVVALIHDLMARLITFQHDLEPELGQVGGQIRVGLYEAHTRVDDLRGRVAALRSNLATTAFLRDLYAFDPSVYHVLDSTAVPETVTHAPLSETPSGGGGGSYGATDSGPAGDSKAASASDTQPKLHVKSFLYLSRESWDLLISGPPMAAILQEYLVQRGRQIREGPQANDSILTGALERTGERVITPALRTLSAAERRRMVLYLAVGSPNQDYRSMLMDGEAAVLISGFATFDAVPDFLLLAGAATWVEDRAALDRGLPPQGWLKRLLARVVRMAL